MTNTTFFPVVSQDRLTVPVQRSMEFGEAIQKQGNNLSSSADKLKGTIF